jgi:hypothetical protein
MKPLPVLTEEDWCIWLRLRAGQFDSSSDDTWLEVVDAYEASDRGDAELMFERMNHWEWGRTPPHKWWFEDWPGPDGRSRTPFDDACYT